jgi:type I restriction enzyme S subunit
MSFPKYQNYKESGVEWLGTIPAHWTTSPLKHVADFINGAAFKPDEWGESGVPIIRIQNLNGGDDFNFFDGDIDERYLVHDGDLLFGWSGNRGTSFGPFLWRSRRACALNQHIFRVVPYTLDRLALFWILKAVTLHVEDQAHGIIGMVHVTKGDLGAIQVPIPPEQEAAQISEFLDRETAKTDALVAEQRRLMELLKEKRQAVISHAVTKGLNPHAPMKDSGIEWLGEVPAHWRVMALKRLVANGTSISYGIVQPGEPLEEGVPFVQTTNMSNRTFDLDELQKTSQAIADLYPRSRLSGGEVLLGIRASIGAAHVAPSWLAGANLSRGVARIVPAPCLSSSYLVAYFTSDATSRYWELSKQGSTFNEVSIETVREISLCVPPLAEQKAISDFVAAKLGRFNGLISATECAIDLLLERRTALISAAVTGQIDVRNIKERRSAA